MPDSAEPARLVATRLPLVELDGETVPLPKTAWIEVDLDAIAGNARAIAAMLPADARVQPVVKADAYGHGAVAVSRALVASGIESLAVATFDEGIELRQAGIDVPILVLFPIPAEMAAAALRNHLSITVGDHELSGRTFAVLSGAGDVAPEDRIEIHLEVETGLGRGGVMPEDAPALARRIGQCPQATLGGLWTHLQAAGNPAITAAQQAGYSRAAALMEASGIRLPLRHFSASGGILASTAAAFDAARIGLSLYGLIPDGLEVAERNRLAAAGLKPALSLRARPVRVANLPAGWGVSYGPTFKTARPSVIATLPLGYADGWPRSLSNKAEALVRGCRVPQAGTVAMDALMVDVTDVPGPAVTIDDEFTLIGRQGEDEIAAHHVAQWGNTISYEIISAMSGRLPRVYYAAAKPVAIRVIAREAP